MAADEKKSNDLKNCSDIKFDVIEFSKNATFV